MTALLGLIRQFTIRLRMWGAIGVVLSLFALVGLVGLVGISKIRALNADFMAHSIHEVETVSSIRQHLALVRMHEKQMVIDYEDGVAVLKHREAWLREIEATRKAFESLLHGEEDEDNKLARDSMGRMEHYRERSVPVLNNIQDGGYDNARVADRMLTKAKEDVAAAEANLEQIAKLVSGEAQATQHEFEAAMTSVLLAFAATLVVVVLIVTPTTLLNSHSITQPIAYAAQVADAISKGDLSSRVRVEGRDEATLLLRALDQMQASLRKLVAQVHTSSQSLQSVSGEVASGNADLSHRTEQTASSLQQTSSSMVQLTGAVTQTADSARTANQLACSASEVAARGGQVVSEVVSTMNQIHTSSQKIADIIGTIDGIAFQTNILALNAAVEAARAGEQGRGFAVVASEVRSLAQRSAEAAREIKTLIGASVQSVEAGSRLVADAGSTMGEIVASVQRVSDIIGEISAAAAEQSSGIAQVNQAVNHLDQMTQQNAALVEQSAAAAESLKDQSHQLAQTISNFKLDAKTEAGTAAPPPRAVAQQLIQRAGGAKPPATAPRTMPAPRPASTSPQSGKAATHTVAQATATPAGPAAPRAASASAPTSATTAADDDWTHF